MIEAFCEQYLGENYDYVFGAVHTDQEHVHGHIIFNSVNRITGYKYRYQKGDWEKEIQPITDRICEEHGLAKLMYDKQQKIGKSYAEYQAEKEGRYTLKKIIQSDVDYMISCSDSWQDFLNQMEMLGYEFRMGYSNKLEREYMTCTVPGRWTAKRLSIGSGIPDPESPADSSKRPDGTLRCRTLSENKTVSYETACREADLFIRVSIEPGEDFLSGTPLLLSKKSVCG